MLICTGYFPWQEVTSTGSKPKKKEGKNERNMSQAGRDCPGCPAPVREDAFACCPLCEPVLTEGCRRRRRGKGGRERRDARKDKRQTCWKLSESSADSAFTPTPPSTFPSPHFARSSTTLCPALTPVTQRKAAACCESRGVAETCVCMCACGGEAACARRLDARHPCCCFFLAFFFFLSE